MPKTSPFEVCIICLLTACGALIKNDCLGLQSFFYLPGYRGLRWTGLHAFWDTSKDRMAWLHFTVLVIFLFGIFLRWGHVSGRFPLSTDDCVMYLILLWCIVVILSLVCVQFWVQHKREDSVSMHEFLAECRAIMSRLDMRAATAHASEAQLQEWETTLVDLLQAMNPGTRP